MSDATETPNPIKPSRSAVGVSVQIIGFAIGIFLLGWAVRMALRPENREQLSKLSDATPGELMLLLVLAALSVGFNGIIFWVVLNPIHRIRATDVIATNAIATFLAYLPFKLSVVSRFVIHNRRDKVPVLTIGAWIIAEAILMGAALTPLVLTSIWLKEVNLLWWIVSLTGVCVGTAIGSALARQLAGDVGLTRLSKIGIGEKLSGSDAFSRIHSGFEMLGHPRATLIANAFRLIDIITFALRFYVAARVLELPISMQDALLLGATYFIIGAASPAGMLGTREAGTIGIAELVGISSNALSETESGQVPIAATVLFVTAVEAIVNLGCAGFGIAWLKARKPLDPEGQFAETELIGRSIEGE
tara:strand:+ start:64037 stop:65119 length:1083 start_codon:yes stop_codon:yes gene_type:complete